jgi:hypothetical protein
MQNERKFKRCTFVPKNMKEKDQLEDLTVVGEIILKLILKK